MNFAFEHFDIDDFDSYCLVWIRNGVTCFIIFTLIDLAGVTLANSIREGVGILFYLFAGCVVHVGFTHHWFFRIELLIILLSLEQFSMRPCLKKY